MIPIIAVSNLINGVIAAALAARIDLHHREVHSDDNENAAGAHYFVAFYLSVAIMWLLYSLPGIFVADLDIITLSQVAANVFIYITAIIAMQIIFISLNKKYLGYISAIAITIVGIVYITGEYLYALQYVQVITPPYVYWHPNSPTWLPIMTGITAALGTFTFIITFFVYGLRSRHNNIVFSRAIHLASGMTFLLSASVLYFILSNSGGLAMTTLASLLGIVGLLIMLRGIKY